MRFGIFDHLEMHGALGELYENRLRLLEAADEAGFWGYHKAEHHFTVLDGAPSSTVFLAAASQRTTRIKLGSLVVLLPFYNPLRLIEEICLLDQLSRGRAQVGVGKGVSPVEHALWGLEPQAAGARFEEAFAIVRQGLANTHLRHHGEAFGYDAPMPHSAAQEPHPPFWYPGNIEYAGQHRLNTITGGPPELVAPRVARFRELIEAPEVDWSGGHQPTIGVTAHIYVAETDAEARKRVATAFPAYHQHLVSLWERYDTPLPGGGPTLGGDTDRALSVRSLVAGSTATLRSYLDELVTATGVDYFVGAFHWGDLSAEEAMHSLGLFADEVMPAFR